MSEYEQMTLESYMAELKASEEKASEPQDDYIREHPTCFYVFGHYLNRLEGWHKMPQELPELADWHLVDVVAYGKKTGFVWMEHRNWEAKHWTFRSIGPRRNCENIDILAWKLSDDED